MKKIVIAMVAGLAVGTMGCKDDKEDNGGNGGSADTCTTTQTGLTRCTENVLETCDGAKWGFTQDCGTELICTQTGANMHACLPDSSPTEAEEYGACDGSTVMCQEGLDCIDLFGGVCLTDCSADPSVCDADEYCVEDQSCFWTSEEGEFCLSEGACASGECEPIHAYSYATTQCVTSCDPVNVGTTTGCGTDTCLTATARLPEFDGENPVECPAGDGDCNTGEGYSCMVYSDGDFCAKYPTVCGNPIDPVGELTDDMIDADVAAEDFSRYCAMANANQFCAPPADGTGVLECAMAAPEPGYMSLWTVGQTCAEDIDCAIAGGTCMGLTEGPECASPISVCAVFCEDEEGTELTCPTALPTCSEQDATGTVSDYALAPSYVIYEGGVASKISCDFEGDGSECTDPFICMAETETEAYCARYPKVCTE